VDGVGEWVGEEGESEVMERTRGNRERDVKTGPCAERIGEKG
jgi:hypothetical protein